LYRYGPVVPQQARAGAPIADLASHDVTRFPALGWLDLQLAALPQTTRVVLVLPPVHAASLNGTGQESARSDDACKASLGAVARQHGAGLIDYRVASILATRDENFWDPLHYRVGIAKRIELDIAALLNGQGADDLEQRAGLWIAPRR
jgi:hypothetical protein